MNQKILPPIPIQSRTGVEFSGSAGVAPPSYRASVQPTASLDIPQRLERKLAQYNSSSNTWKRWLFEIVSWSTSAACMGAAIGLLLYSRDQLLSERTFELASYNVLSKIASAALILPISEAIGQLKWTWFHGTESKEMIDFEIFDKASRGAWGSFLLLFRTKGQSLAALGAILTLLLLATDTFFQQATDFPNRWAREHVTGAIPRVHRYEPFYTPEYFQGMETSLINPALRPIVGKFMVDNGTQPITFANGTRPEVPLTCPSSNCTWADYDTLAVCSQCVEVSDLLDFACLTTTLDWSVTQNRSTLDVPHPNKTMCGYYLNTQADTPILMSGYIVENASYHTVAKYGEALLVRSYPLVDMLSKVPILGGSIKFKHIRNPILDALIVSASNGAQSVYGNATPVAHECMLAWCIQTIRSSYALGDYKEQIIASKLNTTSGSWPWEAHQVHIDDELAGWYVTYEEDVNIASSNYASNTTNLEPSSMEYGSSKITVSNVLQAFDDYFPSSYTVKSLYETPMLRYKNYLAGPNLRKLQFNPFSAPNNVSRHMERLAKAMTDVMRSDVDSYEMVPGLAYNRKQFVAITWEWLIFPIALLLLTLIFLVATIMRTSSDARDGLEVWKTSAMPALIYSLPKEVQQELGVKPSSQGQVGKVKIRLQPSRGWRVSGHNLASPTWIRRPNHQPPPGWI